MFFSSWLLPRLHDQGVGHFLEICGAKRSSGHPFIKKKNIGIEWKKECISLLKGMSIQIGIWIMIYHDLSILSGISFFLCDPIQLMNSYWNINRIAMDTDFDMFYVSIPRPC
jgi:hypothetical protein